MSWLPVAILAVVFLLIAVRQVGGFRFRIWQVMCGGAAAVLLTGQIGLQDSIRAIDPGVMVFLFGMFTVGAALEKSGYLYALSHRIFGKAATVDRLVLSLLLVMGILSAFLMNDTLAIIGTPLVIHYARKFGISPQLLLLTLCVAITTGSVMSPIGNPQNLLVAMNSGLANPFVTFFMYLAIPSCCSLLASYIILKRLYREEFGTGKHLVHEDEPVADARLAGLSRWSLVLVGLLAAYVTAGFFIPVLPDLPIPLIGIIAAVPVLLLSGRRAEIIRAVDWRTLLFFAGMFILMESVFNSGVFQSVIDLPGIASPPLLFAASLVLSQFISNVPFVALFLPVLDQAGIPVASAMALAAGSTLAGNLSVLGAASNVIVIQNAEREGETLTFREFLRAGVPVTVVTAGIYLGWLALLPV